MKKLACEMCGSNNVVKEDGLWVCQNCGAKYSPEEAKKMMVEGTVAVKGTVKVDDTSKIENYKKLARRHYGNREYDEAYKFYDKILNIDSDDWESIFFKGMSSAWQSSIDNIKLSEVVNASENALKILKNDGFDFGEQNSFKLSSAIGTTPLLKGINDIEDFKICISGNINYISVELFNALTYEQFYIKGVTEEDFYSYKEQMAKIYIPATEYALNLLENRCFVEKCSIMLEKCSIVKNLANLYYNMTTDGVYQKWSDFGHGYFPETIYMGERSRSFYTQKCEELIDKYIDQMKEIDSNYEPPSFKKEGGRCYIATSVYGSYDCPEVWTLRRFRDNNLLKTFYGRLFVKIYYTFSPSLVKYFGDKKLFKKLFKSKLDKLVEKLQKGGVESTYYIDK